MNKKNIKLVILIANIVAVIGCFLPFASLFGYGVNFIEGDGVFVVVLSIVAVLVALFKPKFAFIPNAISLFVPIYDITQAPGMSDFLDIGAYMIIAGTAVAIIASITALVKKL